MTTFGDRLFFSNGVPVGGDLLGLLGTGSVWYVDPNSGDDANPGDAPDSAFATLQKALDSTTGTTASSGGFAGGNADVIIRMPGQETVTAAIDADVAPNTTIIASTAGQQLFGDRLNAYTAAAATYTTGPVLRVYFRNVSLYGLAFGGRASTASDAQVSTVLYEADSAVTAVQTGGGGQFFTVAGCLFRDASSSAAPYALFLHGAGPCTIYKNQFGYATTALSGQGIALGGSSSNNCTDVRIKDNLFINLTSGITVVDGTVQWMTIEDNYFCGCTDAFTLAAGCGITEGFVVNNRFDTSRGASSWSNSIGSGDTLENIVTDTGLQFSGNMYNFDNAGTGATV